MSLTNAIVAGTPWQLMGAVTLVERVPGFSLQNTDLYLRMAFSGSREVAGRLAKMGFFRHVFTIGTSSEELAAVYLCAPELSHNDLQVVPKKVTNFF